MDREPIGVLGLGVELPMISWLYIILCRRKWRITIRMKACRGWARMGILSLITSCQVEGF